MAVTKKKYFEGVGSRKRATARVRVYEGKETSVINGIPLEVYLKNKPKEMAFLLRPLVVAGMTEKLYFSGKVRGGGVTGLLGALRMGLARAIVLFDESTRSAMTKENLLSRDIREVESKKYFLRKARKRPQYSKR